MATADIYAGPGDGFVRKFGGAWSGISATGSVTGNDAGPTSTGDYLCMSENTNPMAYRGFLPFNMSGAGVPGNATISAIDLKIYITAKGSSGGGTTANNSVCVVQGTPASNTTLATTDYGNVGSTEWASRFPFASFATSAYETISLNSTAITEANSKLAAAGYFVVALRSGYDVDNTAPTGNSNIQTRYSEFTGTSSDPYITVTYSIPSRTTSDSWAWSDVASKTVSRTTSDSWAWSDSALTDSVLLSGTLYRPRNTSDAWAWSDTAAPYWRAKLQPVLVQAEGANTTSSGSHTLPVGTVNVASTSSFPSSGTFVISSSWDQTEVTYTGKTSTTFTGCTGGTGTFASGSIVMARDAESHFPQVVALDTSDTPRIMVAYVQKPGHGGSIGGKIAAKISSNGGLTWGTQFTLQNFINSPQYTGGGFVLQRLKNGRLLIMWYEGDIGTGSAGLVKSYISYSDDDGTSWSTPVRLTSPFHANVCAVGFDGYLDTSASANATYGDFYVTCYGNDTAAYDNTATYNRLMKVTDGGAAGTWTSVGTINTLAQLDGRASEEASLTVLDNGTWVSHMRVELKAPTYTTLDRYQATSTDNGVTWSGHTRILQQLANAAVSHQMPETHMITQGTDYAHGGQTITYFSTDRGTTWTNTAAYYRLEATDATYSIGNGSDFVTISSTIVPGRRVLNAIGQERSNQAGAQVKFQWYEVPNLPLTADAWAWSDTATCTQTRARTTSDTWAWSDSVARTPSKSRTTTDTWAWSDSAVKGQGQGRNTFLDTWTWTDSATRTVSLIGTTYTRTTTDTWTWVDSVGSPTTYKRIATPTSLSSTQASNSTLSSDQFSNSVLIPADSHPLSI